MVQLFSHSPLSPRTGNQTEGTIPHDYILPVICTVCVTDGEYIMPFRITG